MHGCPCGYWGDPQRECSCSSTLVSRYQKRISGPMLDRIDIYVDVSRVAYDKLSGDGQGETSAHIRARVESARERQRRRFQGTAISSNAEMAPSQVREYCRAAAASTPPPGRPFAGRSQRAARRSSHQA